MDVRQSGGAWVLTAFIEGLAEAEGGTSSKIVCKEDKVELCMRLGTRPRPSQNSVKRS